MPDPCLRFLDDNIICIDKRIQQFFRRFSVDFQFLAEFPLFSVESQQNPNKTSMEPEQNISKILGIIALLQYYLSEFNQIRYQF